MEYECEICGEDCFVSTCLDKEPKMKLNYWTLQKLKKEQRELRQTLKRAESDENFYAIGDRLEGLSIDIQMIEENIPVPPNFKGKKYDECGNRLDNKGRRILLVNNKYERIFAR